MIMGFTANIGKPNGKIIYPDGRSFLLVTLSFYQWFFWVLATNFIWLYLVFAKPEEINT